MTAWIRPAVADDLEAVRAFLAENHSARVARRGELMHPLDHGLLVAQSEAGGLAGVLTYVVHGEDCEVLTLHAAQRRTGVGTALLDAVAGIARDAGCTHLWLVTTNDNVDALRFYQRRGFRLRALRSGAVDDARATLKPEIPEVGDHGIALRDEIELERGLDAATWGLPSAT